MAKLLKTPIEFFGTPPYMISKALNLYLEIQWKLVVQNLFIYLES